MPRLKLDHFYTAWFQNNGYVFHPDFIIYDFDKQEYDQFWRQQKAQQNAYLYTDGLQIYPVNAFQYVWQQIKGFFGLENHCHPNKIELTLAKMAYRGYLQGYHSSDLASFDPPIISERFMTLVSSPRSRENSSDLQQLLVSYYVTHSAHFPSDKPASVDNYAFGKTFAEGNLYHFIPAIDSQSPEMIDVAIHHLHGHSKVPVETAPNSLFAERYALYLARNQRYHEALSWYPHIVDSFKEQYFDYFLSKKEFVQAVNTIVALSQSGIKELQHAVARFKSHIREADQLALLKPYPEFAKSVAKSYWADATREKAKYGITKLFTGNHILRYLSQAVALDPTILDNDHTMNDLTVKEEWFVYVFDKAIREKQFDKAWSIYEAQHDKIQFNSTNVLLDALNLEWKTNNDLLKDALAHHNKEDALRIAKLNLELAQKIKTITGMDDAVKSSRINFIRAQFEIEKLEHPATHQADLALLTKQEQLLAKYSADMKSAQVSSLHNEVLLRQIDCLIEHVKVPINADAPEIKREFIEKNKESINRLKDMLLKFVKCNEKVSTNEQKQLLGKMYYILGDVYAFFDGQATQAALFFEKAYQTVPENIYYQLRYYEISNDERSTDIRDAMNAEDSLHEAKYDDWFKERWNDEIFMSEAFDIHTTLPQSKSFFASLFS